MRRFERALACAVLIAVAQGCAVVGPASVAGARSAYNAVINETEDEQILAMIVRRRYDRTFGMLGVSSVTASLRVSASVGADFGFGPHRNYDGNLVPLSVGAGYEENPTISYAPLRGEQFVERMLAPVTAEQALLLSRMSTDQVEVLRFVVRRANGLANPVFASRQPAGNADAFDRLVELWVRLRELGALDIVRSEDGGFAILLHNWAADESADVAELLRLVGVEPHGEPGAAITLPLRFYVGAPRKDGVDLETPSAYDVIEAAAEGVAVPDEHVSEGLATASPQGARAHLIDIRSSSDRPDAAAVAVVHEGWWFFVDGRDAQSKQAFMILRTLIGLRLDDAAGGQKAPVLTVPVSR